MLRDLYAPDIRIWHNTDRREQSFDENVRVLKWLGRNVSDLRYEDVRREPTSNGFVQQHVLRGTTLSGVEIEVPACLVVTVTDGKIGRIDEYIDSAALVALTR
jgi:ketosteroid isomerase-like protein